MPAPVPVVGVFGPGRLRLTLVDSVPSGALVLAEEDDMLLEDAYKRVMQTLKGGVPVFAPPADARPAVAVWSVGAELARGGPVKEAVFAFTDPALLNAYALALAKLLEP